MSSPLGLRIKRAREQLGWTRAELARKTDIPYSTLKHIETMSRDITQPATRAATSEANLQRLADVLELDYGELRIFAGYAIRPSANGDDARERLGAFIQADPRLEKALKTIMRKGDQSVIDQAATYLEYVASRLG